MISVSEVVLTAAGFLGIGMAGVAERPDPVTETSVTDEDAPLSTMSLLSPGEPYFEAVAAELRKSGHLDG